MRFGPAPRDSRRPFLVLMDRIAAMQYGSMGTRCIPNTQKLQRSPPVEHTLNFYHVYTREPSPVSCAVPLSELLGMVRRRVSRLF